MTRLEKITSLYTALTGDANVTPEELNPYASLADTVTLEAISASITASSVLNFAALPTNDLLNYMFINLFGYTQAEVDALRATEAGAAGFAYWADELTNNSDVVNVNTIAIALLNGAGAADEASAIALVADEVTAYEAAYPDGGDTPVDGDTFVLTSAQDNVTGTAADDTFKANVSQNGALTGALTNTVATGDMIDGKGGNDTLVATMINDETVNNSVNFAPMPEISNVESIRVKALENAINGTVALDKVILDADDITGENHYASDESRTDLVITNVDITSTQITNDITLEMKDTQQNSDLEVYFNQQDLVAKPAETTSNAEFFIQVADGAAANNATPLANIKFDLDFTQDGTTYSFTGLTSTDGTYAGLKTAIEVAFLQQNLTGYTVALGDTFNSFTTNNNQVFNLDYTGNFVTVSDDEGTAFSAINFTPSQLSGTELAIILAKSDVDADTQVSTFKVESTITLDNVGRGSNGGEVVIGSTSNSNSSTGVEIIHVIVENSSVVQDISSTNSALKQLTLTNGDVKGDFVLTNAAYAAGVTAAANGGTYSNVDEANFTVGMEQITATNFDGDIVLGRDANIVDLGTLAANVAGNVTYNATLNDDASYIVTTGSGVDTLNITLDDSILEADGKTNTSVTINTNGGNDTVAVNEDNTALENTTATINTGAGDDVVRGNDVSVTVTAGTGNDVIYAENTGAKAIASLGTAALFTPTVAATDTVIHTNGTVSFLAGKTVQVTLATDGAAGVLTADGYQSKIVEITASTGNLTTVTDLNNAVLEAINGDSVLSKIATASVDEANNVVIQYLVDGLQVNGTVELTIKDDATLPTSISAAMANEYRDLVNDSSLTNAAILGLWTAATAPAATVSANTFTGNIATITIASTAGDTVSFKIGDDVISYTSVAGTIAGDAAEMAAALNAAGYIATFDATTVAVISNEEISIGSSVTAAGVASTLVTTVASNAAIADGAYANLLGTDSDVTNAINANNTNSVNGNSGDDVIVLSSDATGTVDTVVWTDYSQGNDTIVHFDTTIDKLDFTAYLTGTVPGFGSGSTSAQSEVALTNTAVATEAFTADSINLISWTNLDVAVASATTHFADLTIAELTAALNADADNTITTQAGLYQTTAKSVLVIQNNEAGATDAGEYAAYELTYANTTVAAGAAKDFTVKLIGNFDLGDATLAAATDFAL